MAFAALDTSVSFGLIQGDNARISHVLGYISLFPAEVEEIMQML